MLVTKEEITQYIPQRPPIVMVHRLLSADDTGLRTGFDVEPDNVFIEKGVLMPPGLVENIAQSAAVRVGYLAKQRNEPVPIGYIGGISNLEVLELPAAGTSIETTIAIEREVMGATIAKGSVFQDGRLLAECEMKIFVPQK
ncbi:3-hydroxyacyl-ACP dehydratase [Chitinophaga sedimenti]|uniref:3-hydroxyacyl-ACP dehydratase n=1 Tax=Chitinophaga sedimenti TaxID=2033606 RepID=UPI0020055E59|nr:3-hydroxyacyl-ACP dehydratase [Chitinophaga sedimenti]MCK7560104.1 3-hydroxyacyl-ACP dehydratase [Chitinophaga sedimenti]